MNINKYRYRKLILVFLISLLAVPVFACRYTVREIGLADFGTDNYHLYFYKDSKVTAAQIKQFKRISYAALLDANVQTKIIDILSNPPDSALKYYNAEKNHSSPIAILVDPDGKNSLTFHLANEEKKFKESVWTLLEDVISSSTRNEILKKIVQSYAVVLFIESNDNSENEKILGEINLSIKTISSTKNKMPKPVDNPPSLVILKHDQLKNERVLLWSLGLNEALLHEPALAIIYGRGRIMGQALQNALLQQININNLLTIVGADCECGLDRSWIMGKMMPIRWDKQHQKDVIKWHKFDAENPFVKAEMSQILSISPNKVRKQGASGNGTLYGYTESVIKIVKDFNEQTAKETTEDSLTLKNNSGNNSLLYIVIFFILILLIGVFMFIISKKREL